MSPYPFLLVAILLAAAEPQFAGTATARGWVEQCQLAGWSADGPAWVDSAGKQIFDVVRWGGGATRITEQAVVLVDGSVLVGQVERFTREHLLIKGTTIQVQPIPWESVLVVVFTAGASVEDLQAWSAWATKLDDTTDHVMRNNGSTATGKLKLQIGDNATWMRGAPNLILESVPPQETDQPAANSAGGKSQDLELPIREIACFAPSPHCEQLKPLRPLSLCTLLMAHPFMQLESVPMQAWLRLAGPS